MDERISALLAEIAQQGREHDAKETDYTKRMLNLDPDTAQLVHILARSSRAKSILEIGTSNAYSTIWLAAAAAAVGGRVVTIDHSSEKQALARENLHRAGLLDSVELLNGKAATLVRELAGPFDLLFIDADRANAPANLQVLLPKLTPSVLLLADNVHSHPEDIAGYLDAVKRLDGFDHIVVPIGKGLSLAYRGAH